MSVNDSFLINGDGGDFFDEGETAVPLDPLLQLLLAQVEAGVLKSTITLLVGGQIVEGTLTSNGAFRRELLAALLEGLDNAAEVAGRAGNEVEALKHKTVADATRGEIPGAGLEMPSEPSDRYDWIHLDDVTIRQGGATMRVPALRVEAYMVAGWFLGQHGGFQGNL